MHLEAQQHLQEEGCVVDISAYIGDLLVPPTGLIPWFLTEGNTYLYFAASPFLRPTSAPIQFTIVLGVLGTQETLCYLVAGLLERDHLHPTPPTD